MCSCVIWDAVKKKNVVKNIQESGISKSPVGCGNGKEYPPGLMMEKEVGKAGWVLRNCGYQPRSENFNLQTVGRV